jgi:hypothetical protein
MEQTTRTAVLCLRLLACLARTHVLGDIDVLPHPEGKAANKRLRLGPTEMPPKLPVVALAEHLYLQPVHLLGCTACRQRPGPGGTAGSTHQESSP